MLNLAAQDPVFVMCPSQFIIRLLMMILWICTGHTTSYCTISINSARGVTCDTVVAFQHSGHLHCDLWQTEFSTRILIDFFSWLGRGIQHLFPGCQWVLDILLMIVVSRVDVNKFLNHDKKIFLKLFFWTISHMRPKSKWHVTLTKIRARPQTLWCVTGRIDWNGTVYDNCIRVVKRE